MTRTIKRTSASQTEVDTIKGRLRPKRTKKAKASPPRATPQSKPGEKSQAESLDEDLDESFIELHYSEGQITPGTDSGAEEEAEDRAIQELIQTIENTSMPSTTAGPSSISGEALKSSFLEYSKKRYFAEGSPLQEYLHLMCDHSHMNASTTLGKVLRCIKDIVSANKYYDPNITSIIIPDFNLKKILKMDAIHLTQLKDIVLTHLSFFQDDSTKTPKKIFTNKSEPFNWSPIMLPPPSADAITVEKGIYRLGKEYTMTSQSLCVVSKGLRRLLCSILGQERLFYSYYDITQAISGYIITRRHSVVATGNIKILKLDKDDLLCQALGVRHIFREQIKALIQAQILYLVEPDGTFIKGCQADPNERALCIEKYRTPEEAEERNKLVQNLINQVIEHDY